jgi:hypothetical protein
MENFNVPEKKKFCDYKTKRERLALDNSFQEEVVICFRV